MWNKSLVLQYPALFQYLPERTRKENKHSRKDIRSQHQDMNPTSAEYEGITTTRISMVGSLEMSRKKM